MYKRQVLHLQIMLISMDSIVCVCGCMYFLCVSVSVSMCSPSIATSAWLRNTETIELLETVMVVRETEVDRNLYDV